jgi:hypothetical protein
VGEAEAVYVVLEVGVVFHGCGGLGIYFGLWRRSEEWEVGGGLHLWLWVPLNGGADL